MNYQRCLKTAVLFTLLVTFIGCKSKQENPGAGTGAPQGKAVAPAAPAAPAAAPQAGTAQQAVLPKDKADAETAASRVLSQFTTGDFSALYKESAPGFKQIGTEGQFVAKFQHARQNVGALKNPKEVNIDARPDKSIVLVYRLENEHFATDLRLTFARAQSGKMELSGINQHDEPKKK